MAEVNGWRFAVSRRWLGYLGLVVLFAVGCVFLSQWQLGRRAEARAEIAAVEANWELTPRPIAEVMPLRDRFDEKKTWTPVTLTGRYLRAEELLVRGRPRNGSPGFEQLVPLQLSDGSIFVVNRGWLRPGDAKDYPDSVPPPPAGTVTVVARLKAGEPILAGRSAPDGQIATINLPTIAKSVDDPTYIAAYGLLVTEDPEAPKPAAATRPTADEGPHLSYAFQWLVFGAMAFFGLGWAIRQEYRIKNAEDPAERERAARRKRRSDRRPRSDADVEDSILDAADHLVAPGK